MKEIRKKTRPHHVRFLVSVSPRKQQYLGYCDGSKQDEDHLSMHQIMAPVLLLNHTMPHPVNEEEQEEEEEVEEEDEKEEKSKKNCTIL